MAAKTLLTEADFDALPEQNVWKVELSDGELVMTAAPRPLHTRVRDELGLSMANFAKAHHLGAVLSEAEFKLAEDTIRIPDLAFLSAARLAKADPDARLVGAPDLAVEVISPSNTAADMDLKIQRFLQAGTRIVWVVYPKSRRVYIHKPGERPDIREAPQALDAPELLPGWSISLAELFDISKLFGA